MRGFVLDIETCAPFLMAGAFVGALAFGILLLVLVPVFRHTRAASMPKGFLALGGSAALKMLGIVVVYLLWEDGLIAFLIGELVGYFVGWGILAWCVVRTDRMR